MPRIESTSQHATHTEPRQQSQSTNPRRSATQTVRTFTAQVGRPKALTSTMEDELTLETMADSEKMERMLEGQRAGSSKSIRMTSNVAVPTGGSTSSTIAKPQPQTPRDRKQAVSNMVKSISLEHGGMELSAGTPSAWTPAPCMLCCFLEAGYSNLTSLQIPLCERTTLNPPIAEVTM